MNRKEYMREYMLKRYYKRRQLAFDILGEICVNCGSKENLEIDHIDPSLKTMNLSKMWNITEQRYLNELNLCQVLCNACHKTKSSIDNGVEHGGGVSGKRNCPCNLCKSKKAEYMKSYKS